MAVLRWRAPARALPDDFGLGLAVVGLICGALLLFMIAAASAPTHGPEGEAHQPPQNTTYVDIQAPAASSSVTSLP
jgi:hypothetical protein